MESKSFRQILAIVLDGVKGVFIVIHFGGDFSQGFGEGHNSHDFLICWLRA
jgi:hypothetical protein